MASDAALQPFPPFGNLAIVREPHWSALSAALRANPALSFDTGRYPYFDRVIAENCRTIALYNNLQLDYPMYAGLRFNIAALRNYLATSMVSSSFSTSDKKRVIPRLKNIAAAIGDAIANGEINPHTAGVSGAGAAEIYDYLLFIQDQPGLWPKVRGLLRKLFCKRQLAFNLLPIESTPFSPANLAPPVVIPTEIAKLLASRAAQAKETKQQNPYQEAERMAKISEQLIETSLALDNVDNLKPDLKAESVEEAKKILRWLRNLQATDKDMEEWLDQGTPQATLAKTEKLQQIVQTFVQLLQRQKTLAGTPSVVEAIEAIRAISLFVGEQTLAMLPENHPRAADLDFLLDELPDAWEKRSAQSVRRLLDVLEAAIERIAGQAISDLSTGEKLAQASVNISKNLNKLRNVDTMGSPAREESVELAREILDKLKNLSFSQKSAKEMVETGRPEEKLALAEKLDEGVEAYTNIISEIVHKNPKAIIDKKITEATDATACFSHAVALMAAKEMPGSVAAAQQISAEAAQDPEEWKKLQNHTVDRLVKSMEGGLEKAVGEMQQQQEQQQQEEQGQEAALQAQQANDGTRKKRRRRRSSSGKGVGKARKQAQDMTADDAALKQGRFREDKRSEGVSVRSSEGRPARSSGVVAPTVGVGGSGIAALQEVVGSLRGVADASKSDIALVNVAPDDKIVPDDKTQAARFSDREQQTANKPIAPLKRT